jgi:cullin 1
MELKSKAKDAVLSAIEKERDGEQIDRLLLRNVLMIFIDVGMSSMDCYENDFEADMLAATKEHYSRKAAAWVAEDSCPDYMLKADDSLKQVSGLWSMCMWGFVPAVS